MISGQALGVFIVYGCSIHVAPTKDLQFQIPWFTQTFAPAISIHDQSLATLAQLRGSPADSDMVATEFHSMASHIGDKEAGLGNNSSLKIIKEAFLVNSNLRRVQLTIIIYILAQMSGANAITKYLPTIFGLIEITNSDVKVYSTGLYTVTKLICCVVASLFFIDLVGRRKSHMIGISVQITCHSYIAGYINIYQTHKDDMSKGSTDAAPAFVYIHAFGWAIVLYSLPYLFGAELWPNKIRSFGGELSQCFHWIFYFAIKEATPSMLNSLHQWGAFFCLLASACRRCYTLILWFLKLPE
ncbi:general substrate transporter [Penicillium angulare]|uniref:general substrate transporter n=1 Tax=Penicillium angulare TaxID=116970 RepID=UPI002541809B|nr:general substrate transporter [Penicillium angulare]KAJ5287024.1 general substrate transporter [Penicillium angulare]